jgi:hypothetical protein
MKAASRIRHHHEFRSLVCSGSSLVAKSHSCVALIRSRPKPMARNRNLDQPSGVTHSGKTSTTTIATNVNEQTLPAMYQPFGSVRPSIAVVWLVVGFGRWSVWVRVRDFRVSDDLAHNGPMIAGFLQTTVRSDANILQSRNPRRRYVNKVAVKASAMAPSEV